MAVDETADGVLGLEVVHEVLKQHQERLCFRPCPGRSHGRSRLYYTPGPVEEQPLYDVADGPRCFLNLIFELRAEELGAYLELISTKGKKATFAESCEPSDWRLPARHRVVEWVRDATRARESSDEPVFLRLINFHRLTPDTLGNESRVQLHDRPRIERWVLAIDRELRALLRGPDHPTRWKQARNRLKPGHWAALGALMVDAGEGPVLALEEGRAPGAHQAKCSSEAPSVGEVEVTGTTDAARLAPADLRASTVVRRSRRGAAWPALAVCFSYLPDQPRGQERTAFYLEALAGRPRPSTACTVNRRRYQRITVAQLRSLGLADTRLLFESVLPDHVESLEELDPGAEQRLREESRAARVALLRGLRPDLIVVQSRRCLSVLEPDLHAALEGLDTVVLLLASPAARVHRGAVDACESWYARESLRDRLLATLQGSGGSWPVWVEQVRDGSGWSLCLCRKTVRV